MERVVDIIVIGAGPAGLSCAIEAKEAGLDVIVLDKGSVVDSIRRFPTNLVWFSTPELLEIGNVPFVISTVRPTRVDVLNYYQKVCDHYQLDIRPFNKVEDVVKDDGKFVLKTGNGRSFSTKTVVVATGYYDNPNTLGIPGESLPNVFHHYREPFEFFGCDVTVIGGRNSAVEASLDLFRHGARVTLIHRGRKLSDGVKYWILPDIENRIKSGEVNAIFESKVQEIKSQYLLVDAADGVREIKTDFTFVLIGFHPDTAYLERYGVQINPETLAPCFDETTFETNVPGLYVAGSIVAGKNNNKVFVENGRTHGPVIVKAIKSRK